MLRSLISNTHNFKMTMTTTPNPIQTERRKRKASNQNQSDDIESVNLTFAEQSNLKAALAFVVLRRRLLGRQQPPSLPLKSQWQQTASKCQCIETAYDVSGLEFLYSNPTCTKDDENDDCDDTADIPLTLKSSTRRHHIDMMMQCVIDSTHPLYTKFTRSILQYELQVLSGVSGVARRNTDEDTTVASTTVAGLLYDSQSVSLKEEKNKGSIHAVLDGMAHHLVIQLRALRGTVTGDTNGDGDKGRESTANTVKQALLDPFFCNIKDKKSVRYDKRKEVLNDILLQHFFQPLLEYSKSSSPIPQDPTMTTSNTYKRRRRRSGPSKSISELHQEEKMHQEQTKIQVQSWMESEVHQLSTILSICTVLHRMVFFDTSLVPYIVVGLCRVLNALYDGSHSGNEKGRGRLNAKRNFSGGGMDKEFLVTGFKNMSEASAGSSSKSGSTVFSSQLSSSFSSQCGAQKKVRFFDSDNSEKSSTAATTSQLVPFADIVICNCLYLLEQVLFLRLRKTVILAPAISPPNVPESTIHTTGTQQEKRSSSTSHTRNRRVRFQFSHHQHKYPSAAFSGINRRFQLHWQKQIQRQVRNAKQCNEITPLIRILQSNLNPTLLLPVMSQDMARVVVQHETLAHQKQEDISGDYLTCGSKIMLRLCLYDIYKKLNLLQRRSNWN